MQFPKPGKQKKRARPKRGPSKEARADKLFSDYIRSIRRCENECGARDNLDCAHAFSRRYRATRWTLAFALCRRCHTYYTQHPAAWTTWLKARWGDDLYDQHYRTAQIGARVDLDAVIAALETQKSRAI